MFRKNGLMNSQCLLSFVAVTLLVVAGCGQGDSKEFVKIENLKKVTVEDIAQKDESKIPEFAENSVPSKTTGARIFMPVIARIPQEIDAVSQKNLLKGDASTTGGIKLLVKNRQFNKEGDALRISYDDVDLLKILNMDPVPEDALDHFPDWLTQLNGKRVRVRGYMYPTYQETGIKIFVLARDNKICCFGRDPKPYDLIEVQMKTNQSTRYIQNRPFDVVGTFNFDVEYDADDEMFYRLYTITDGAVIEK